MGIVVMGAGGVGSYVGALFAAAGEDVSLIARGAQLAALRSDGLRFQSHLFGEHLLRIPVVATARELPPADLVIFTVKAYDTDAAARQLESIVGEETVILSVQNGVSNATRISTQLSHGTVLAGTFYGHSIVASPGVTTHTSGPGRIVFGDAAGADGKKAGDVLAWLTRCGIPAELTDDIQLALWQKFFMVCGSNGVTALTRLPFGRIFSCPETTSLLRRAMEEAVAVGRAHGASLPDGCIDEAMTYLESFNPYASTSLLQDLAAGKRLELSDLTGEVVRLGAAHGVPTPVNSVILAALRPFETGSPELSA